MNPACRTVAAARGTDRVVPKTGRHPPAARLAAWLGALVLPAVSHAQLTDPALFSQFNAFEKSVAVTTQATYDVLQGICGGVEPTPQCTSSTFQVFSVVRELVQTAEEIRTGIDLQHGLNLDAEGLGFALRWNAAEELLAQGSTVKQFANSQTSVLGARVAALRTASRASLFALDLRGLLRNGYASLDGAGGGGAPVGGTPGYGGPRLGMFLDVAGGYGDKADTTSSGGFENGFDFEGYEYSLGLDYRVSSSLVTGAILGYTDRYIDFDSAQSIVDGHIRSRGYSLIGFAQWDRPLFYAAASAGYQVLDFDTVRRISYPSFDPNIDSTDTATAGSTDSRALLGTLNVGVPLQWRAFGADLYVKADYQDTKIDSFTEGSLATAAQPSGRYQFDVASQKVKSLNTAAGLKLQLVLTPRFGVVVPYLRGEIHREHEKDPRTIGMLHAGLDGEVAALVRQAVNDAYAMNAGALKLQTDAADDSYYTISGGVSAVLRGSTRVDSAGRAGGGMQAYLQYAKVLRLRNYSDAVISGGLRHEF